MSAGASRTREARTGQANPLRAFAALAAASMLLVPLNGAAPQPSRTVLLSLTDSTTLSVLAERVTQLGGRVVRSMEVAGSMLVELPRDAAVPAGSAEVPDVPMKFNATRTSFVTMEPSYRQTIGAPDTAPSGEGVTVALLDTGVSDVADLAGAVEHVNVSGAAQGDGLGHGTFLAGLVAGNGAFRGVAPRAAILDVQVADQSGNTSLSRVLAGLQAVADRPAVRVLNVSLSTGSPLPPQFDPFTRALDQLWGRGVTVVTSAGNDGPDRGTVSSPGTDPVLLTVGALDERATADRADDTVADFSARGTEGDGAKPDLVAPGVSLISTRAPGSLADVENPGATVGGAYFRGSGTSMSAAVTSGAAAVLLGANPGLTPDGVKQLLQRTAYGSATLRPSDGAGAGALDLAAALAAAPTFSATAGPGQGPDHVTGGWGPDPADQQAWNAFAAAWQAGDFAAVQAAWDQLSFQTKQWATRAFSLAVIYAGLGLSEEEFAARQWSARQWSFDEWLARQWSARQWSQAIWEARQWSARQWSARQWSVIEWSATN